MIEKTWVRSGCLAAAFLMAVALFAGTEIAAKEHPFPAPFDKAVHFAYFFAMSSLAFAGIGARWWMAIPVLLAVGAADELYQLTIPGRIGSIWDFAADVVGVAVAAVVWRRARRRAE